MNDSRVMGQIRRQLRVSGITRRLILIVLTLLLIAACNRDDAPTPTPTPRPDQPAPAQGTSAPQPTDTSPAPTATPTPIVGSVVLWHSLAQRDGDALNRFLSDLAATYPDLTVETLFVGDATLLQSYVEAVQAGGGPDLVLAPNWWLGDLVESNSVALWPESGLANAEDTYFPAALESLRWQGAQVGLPFSMELVSLFVNQSLASVDSVPEQLDAWVAEARANPQHGFGLYATLFHLYWGIPAYGGQLLDAEGRAVLNQNEGTAAFLAWLGEASRTPGSYVATDYGMLLDRFKKREFAYFVDGPWAIQELRGALGPDLQIARLPGGPAGAAAPWLYTDGVFMNPNISPEQQEIAALFARELTGIKSGSIFAALASRLPANRQAEIGGDPVLRGFMLQAATAVPMPVSPAMDEVWGYGGDMLVKAIYGTDDPATIVEETTALINDALGP